MIERSAIPLPKELEEFGKNVERHWINGTPSKLHGRAELLRVRTVAKYHLYSGLPLEPTARAEAETLEAAKQFWTGVLDHTQNLPLAPHQSLGMAVVPRSRVVLVAFSHGNDLPTQKAMYQLVEKVNKTTKPWVYELIRPPTQAEYLLLHTLTMRSPLDEEAPKELLETVRWSKMKRDDRVDWMRIHTQVRPKWFSSPKFNESTTCQCPEMALMVGLCKAGRIIRFEPSDVCMKTFGTTLRGEPNFFHEKVLKSHPITTWKRTAYLEEWKPCPGHCKIYHPMMQAMAAAGGPGTAFTTPRGVWFPK